MNLKDCAAGIKVLLFKGLYHPNHLTLVFGGKHTFWRIYIIFLPPGNVDTKIRSYPAWPSGGCGAGKVTGWPLVLKVYIGDGVATTVWRPLCETCESQKCEMAFTINLQQTNCLTYPVSWFAPGGRLRHSSLNFHSRNVIKEKNRWRILVKTSSHIVETVTWKICQDAKLKGVDASTASRRKVHCITNNASSTH